ncbi:MAG: hypothetical protein GVY07_15440 [Bacteroidetes bacterium]|jgi:predicted ester cyclase|nr:hypothetical protein [Bacteroidota bacterium]
MNTKEIKKLSSSYMKIWNAGEEDLLDDFADKYLKVDYTHFENTYNSISEYKAMLKQTHEFFPDLEITLENIIPSENGNSATIIWKYSGTHENGNLFGVESTGNNVTVSGMTLLKFQNGKVVEEKGIVDNLSLMMQLGAME